MGNMIPSDVIKIVIGCLDNLESPIELREEIYFYLIGKFEKSDETSFSEFMEQFDNYFNLIIRFISDAECNYCVSEIIGFKKHDVELTTHKELLQEYKNEITTDNLIKFHKLREELNLPMLIPIRNDGDSHRNYLYGYCNKNKKIVVDFKYEEAFPFINGLARVQKNGYYGFIDENGHEKIPCIYHDANEFTDGVTWVRKGYRWHLINESQEIILESLHDDKTPVLGSRSHLRIDNQMPPDIHHFDFKCPKSNIYVEQLLLVEFKEGLMALNGWFIDPNGYRQFDLKFQRNRSFKNGYAPVCLGGKWGFINKYGIVVIPCIYEDVKTYSDNYFSVKSGGRWGYIGQDLQKLTQFEFDDVNDFSKGISSVKKDNSWKIINSKGQFLIDDEFENAKSGNPGYLLVKKDSKWGLIDNIGNFTIPVRHKSLKPLTEDLYIFMDESKYGVMNSDGKVILEDKFYWLSVIKDSKFIFTSSGEVFDFEGNLISHSSYVDEILRTGNDLVFWGYQHNDTLYYLMFTTTDLSGVTYIKK